MNFRRLLRIALGTVLSLGMTAHASIAVTFNSASDVGATAAGYTASGTATFALGYAPATGTDLTVVKNTALGFISGEFSNLAQGQSVSLGYGGLTYEFVANYYGGTGNDLVLMWKRTRPLAWGRNYDGQLGIGSGLYHVEVPTPVLTDGVLAGRTVIAIAAGQNHSLALCADGTLAVWGRPYGDDGSFASRVPVAVDQSGVLAGKTVVAIAAGAYLSVVLCSDGTVATWGNNDSGQLGNNSPWASPAPVAVDRSGVLAGKTVVAIAAGESHCLALCSDGALVAWGFGGFGQLGNGSFEGYSPVPVAVDRSGVLAGKTVVGIAASYDHSLAVCADGTVAAWGYNFAGQLGNNSTTKSSVPVAVDRSGVLAGKTVVSVSAGTYWSLALCSDGTMAAWGENDLGGLGNGTWATSLVPVAVDQSGVLAGKTVVSVSAGIGHGVAQCSDGTVAAWGWGAYGQFGNGRQDNSGVPVATDTGALAAGERFTKAIAGSLHTLALVAKPPVMAPTVTTGTASSLASAGATLNGTVNANDGSTTVTFQYGPTTGYGLTATASQSPVSGRSDAAVSVAVGGLAAGTTYHFRAVGTNPVGTTYGSDATFTTPVLISSLTATFSAATDVPVVLPGVIIRGGSTATLALGYAPVAGTELMVVKNTGPGFISGKFGNLAQGQSVALRYGGVTYEFVANYYGGTGNDLVLVWKHNRPLAWGYNFFGQLGDGSTTDRSVPVAVPTDGALAGRTVVAVAAGGAHSVALCSDGTVAAWGSNGNGQLGNGSTGDSDMPMAVDRSGVLAGKTVVGIAAGQFHSLALCSDGTVAAWGLNGFGQLGNGGTAQSTVPVAVDTGGALQGKTVVAVAAGYQHSLALCADGTVAAWGRDNNGQLGDGSTTQSTVPVAVDRSSLLAGREVVTIAAGREHSLALCTDGTVAAWGRNLEGQLGNNGTTRSTVPVAVDLGGVLAGKTVAAVAGGHFHSLALCTDGTLAAWGRNLEGQLGNHSNTPSTVPVAVDTGGVLAGRTVVSVAAGQFHSLALCMDGTLAAWGDNAFGELGNSSMAGSSVPVAVATGALADGERLAKASSDAGALHTLALVATLAVEPTYVPAPEIAVDGDGTDISDGDATPDPADDTDFGSTLVSRGMVVHTFTIRNLGDAALSLTGTPKVAVSGAHAADFAVTAPPAASVAVGGSTTFQVTFRPGGLGLRTATLSIASDDSDESSFDFAIQGTSLLPDIPEPQADSVRRTVGHGLKIPVSQLLANDLYATTVAAVDAVSAGGVPVQLVGDTVIYAPAADFNEADSFTYTAANGTNRATTSVNITVVALPLTVNRTLEVTTAADTLNEDDGVMSLREAITLANGYAGEEPVKILFDATVFTAPGPHTIQLGSALPDLAARMDIIGPGARMLLVRRNSGGQYRVFTVAYGANVNLSGLTVTEGHAPDGPFIDYSQGGDGGGIYNNGTLALTGVVVTGNGAGLGGAIGGGTGGDGGGILNVGTLLISDSTINDNYGGAGRGIPGSHPFAYALSGEGGGICNRGVLTIVNSTISGNQAALFNGTDSAYGGGIYNYASGTLTVRNSTITANTSATGGGGIRNDGGSVTLRRSIIAGNIVTKAPTADIQGTVQSEGFNLIGNTSGTIINETGSPGTDITDQDPRLGPLAANGGPTDTHALLADSPALDHGDAGSPSAATDQRGLPRPVDQAALPNAAGGDGSDIGAVEIQPLMVEPIPRADSVTRVAGRGLKIPVSLLLANDLYATTVTAVDAVSTGGVPVQLVDGSVIYMPSADFNEADSFTYTAANGLNQATATVNISVQAVPETPTQNIADTKVTPLGALETTAAGIPGRRYQLQHTSTLLSPIAWTNLGAPQTAPANGQMVFTDPTPTSPGFYRVIPAP